MDLGGELPRGDRPGGRRDVATDPGQLPGRETEVSAYRGAGVYVFRTRRPGLIGRIPLIGRHTAYVGESNAVELRRLAHVVGGGKFGAVAKPWADLKPTHYVIPLPGAPKSVLRAVETLLILLLWPVYNHAKNQWNPRRIPLSTAKRQRAQRDDIRWSFNLRPAHVLLWVAAIMIMIINDGRIW